MSDPTRIDVADTKALLERMASLPRRTLRPVPDGWEEPSEDERWAGVVGPRLSTATVDTLDGDVARWVESWLGTSADLLLLGPVGVGKTWAASAAARARWANGERVQWWSTPALMEQLRPDGDRADTLSKVQRTGVLVLDDLGRNKPTDWALEQLHLVLDFRDRMMLPTVVTSNCSPDDLASKVGRQVASRLLGGDTVGGVVDGPDRRLS